MTEVLANLEISPVVLTGGVAFSVWVEPRFTQDFDVCAVVPEKSVEKLLVWYDGFRSGPERMPSLIRFSLGEWSVDLFLVRDEHDHECMRRAVDTSILGVPVKVVSPEDLLIHKLIKLRNDKRKLLQDASDLRRLLEARGGSTDFDYLRKWLPPEEGLLLEEATSLDEDVLVARLKAL